MRLLRGDIPVIQEQIHARQKQTRGRPVEEESSMKTSVDSQLGWPDGTGVPQGHVCRGDRLECGDRQTVEEQEDHPQREGTQTEIPKGAPKLENRV